MMKTISFVHSSLVSRLCVGIECLCGGEGPEKIDKRQITTKNPKLQYNEGNIG